MPRYRLLIVDDEPRMTQVLGLLAQKWGYEHRAAGSGPEALGILQEFPAEIVLTDLKMPEMDGEELLEQIRAHHPDAVVVMMTAHATVQSAVRAMRKGAYDYIMKPFDNEELRLTIERACEIAKLRQDNAYMRRELGEKYRIDNIIGESPRIREVLAMIERVAPTRATVLVTGESGTGKELVAKALHFRSTRATGPFVRVNCAALAETLLESELFGHEKGAFTGAIRQHRGKFEEADGGTIFLDEIGETSNNFQTKLLRVLQEGTLQRVGSNNVQHVDVRVVAATNRDLKSRLKEGHFREDLYFRLNVVPIHLPALRERASDIAMLAEHFVKIACEENNVPLKTLGEGAMAALAAHNWPGNVRELENVVERAVILSRDAQIGADDLWLPPAGASPIPEQPGAAPPAATKSWGDGGEEIQIPAKLLGHPLGKFLDEMAKIRVLHALDVTHWRKQEAAERLGIDRATLYRQMKKFGITEA